MDGVYGLVGEKLGHSYSPRIHKLLTGCDYRLIELRPEELEPFLRGGRFDGVNVTIPYKKAAAALCAELSPRARALGNVNTVVRRADGSLFGDNTDWDGFEYLVRASGVPVKGAFCAVLGSGGASATVQAVLAALGAGRIVCVSRRGPCRYEDRALWADAEILVNATPVGMYPDNGRAAAELASLPRCRAVFDLIYNPARTKLLLDARTLGIPGWNGLPMLVAQAKAAAERFTGAAIPDGETERVTRRLARETENIVLIGMAGCGKTSVGRALAAVTGRPFFDADEEAAKKAGLDIPAFFARYGEAGFRRLETETLAELTKKSGCVLATGGGAVTVPENLPLLRQNGTVVWLRREREPLPAEGRPMSLRYTPEALYEARRPLYAAACDVSFDNRGVAETAETIREELDV